MCCRDLHLSEADACAFPRHMHVCFQGTCLRGSEDAEEEDDDGDDDDDDGGDDDDGDGGDDDGDDDDECW